MRTFLKRLSFVALAVSLCACSTVAAVYNGARPAFDMLGNSVVYRYAYGAENPVAKAAELIAQATLIKNQVSIGQITTVEQLSAEIKRLSVNLKKEDRLHALDFVAALDAGVAAARAKAPGEEGKLFGDETVYINGVLDHVIAAAERVQ